MLEEDADAGPPGVGGAGVVEHGARPATDVPGRPRRSRRFRPCASLRRSTLIRRVGFSLAREISRREIIGVRCPLLSRSAGSARRIRVGSKSAGPLDHDLAQARLDDGDAHRARSHLLLGQEHPDRAEAGARVRELQRGDRRLESANERASPVWAASSASIRTASSRVLPSTLKRRMSKVGAAGPRPRRAAPSASSAGQGRRVRERRRAAAARRTAAGVAALLPFIGPARRLRAARKPGAPLADRPADAEALVGFGGRHSPAPMPWTALRSARRASRGANAEASPGGAAGSTLSVPFT
jgi:hypothetical protein